MSILSLKRRAKARDIKKNYLKQHNIRKNNWPVPRNEVGVNKVTPVIKNGGFVMDEMEGKEKGLKFKYKTLRYMQIGRKVEKHKTFKNVMRAGEGLPLSQKFRMNKIAKKEMKKAVANTQLRSAQV